MMQSENKDKQIVRVNPRSAWLKDFDVKEFETDIKKIGVELASQQGHEDMLHLQKLCGWSRFASILGLILMPFGAPNWISVILMAIGITTRWALIAHHTCHGAYDHVDESKRYNRFRFGIQSFWRRSNDWLDWMLVEAWNVEHNQLHHYALNEPGGDPDFVEYNTQYLRNLNIPMFMKYFVVAFLAATWKFFYYSPNTFKELQLSKLRRMEAEVKSKNSGNETDSCETNELDDNEKLWRQSSFTLKSILDQTKPDWLDVSILLQNVMLPYALFTFVLLPLPILFILGKECFYNAVINLILADIVSNLYSFVIIVTNHAGPDMYTFSSRCKPLSGEFYLRQIISSADFTTGSDLIDFLQAWLNHQSSHHCFPSLSPLSYQKAQPQIKEICKKHGVPYVQENVFVRLMKTANIMVGAASSIVFPPALEGFPSNKEIIIDESVDDVWDSVRKVKVKAN